MIELTGKVALVTGSSRGIGRACALKLANAGADVIVNYVSSRGEAMIVAESIAAMGRRVWAVRADMGEEEDVECMMDFVRDNIGQLDIVVSNAATGGFRHLLASNSRHFQTAMNTNVLSLVYLVRGALPLLKNSTGRGKVVTISSHGSDMAIPMYGLVGTSKAAMEAIARHLTLGVGDAGVNVNVVKAGLVETDSTRKIPFADEMFSGRTARTMVGERALTADDVADCVLFLSRPMSDLIQGETITVDGGAAIHV